MQEVWDQPEAPSEWIITVGPIIYSLAGWDGKHINSKQKELNWLKFLSREDFSVRDVR